MYMLQKQTRIANINMQEKKSYYEDFFLEILSH